MAWNANDIIEMKLEYLVHGQRCFNVWHYHPLGDMGAFDKPALIKGLLDLQSGLGNGTAVGEFKKLFGNNVEIVSLSAQLIFPTRFIAQRNQFDATFGDVPAPCEVQNIQGTITKRGPLANKHNVGSMHIGGLSTTSYDNGLLTNAQVDRLRVFLDDYLLQNGTDGLTTTVYYPTILNKTKVVVDGKDKYVVSGSTDFELGEPHIEVRTQRSRTVGRGI